MGKIKNLVLDYFERHDDACLEGITLGQVIEDVRSHQVKIQDVRPADIPNIRHIQVAMLPSTNGGAVTVHRHITAGKQKMTPRGHKLSLATTDDLLRDLWFGRLPE